MKVLVTFALEAEFGPWKRLRAFRRAAAESAVFEAVANGSEVRVFLTGVACRRAPASLMRAFDWPPDACISAGLAGGLRRQHRVGAILAAQWVREMKCGRTMECDDWLLETAGICGAGCGTVFCTSDEVFLTPEAKSRLGQTADAVEMESFAILNEAAARGIPAIAVRAISDAAEERAPLDFSRLLDEKGGLPFSRLAGALVRGPQRVPGLIHLGWQSWQAAKGLAKFLDVYVDRLGVLGKRPVRERVAATL